MEQKPIFRRIFDAVIDARMRQANRYIEDHARLRRGSRPD